jgi:predicted NBD/HSP70 family sugar kinase
VALAAQIHPDGIQVAVIGLGGRIVASRSLTHAIPDDPARALAGVTEVAAGLVAAAGRPCVGAGLAVPSAVASPEGTMVGALYLGWPTGTPVRDLHAGQLRAAGITGPGGRPLSCSVGNDINLAALAEHRHGAGRDASHLLMLATGHRGVGGALVLGGALYTGSGGLGMEAGHVSVDTSGLPCPCGGRGCLNVETDAGRFLELAGRPAGAGGPAPGIPLIDQAIDLLRGRPGSDPLVAAAVATVTERLGVGLAGLVNVINPDRIVLGSLYRFLLEADPAGLRAAVADRSPWGRGAGVPLVPAALEQASLLGAAEIAWQPILDDPSLVNG